MKSTFSAWEIRGALAVMTAVIFLTSGLNGNASAENASTESQTALPSASVIWLDELNPALGEEGWNAPTLRTSLHGKPMKVNGASFDRGVGIHSPSILCIELSGEAGVFATTVGIDDDIDRPGDVEFLIRSDDKILWRSGMMGSWQSKSAEVALEGVTRLYLQTIQKPGEYGNHADWADARFLGLAKRPTVVPVPSDRFFPDDGGDPFSRFDEPRLQWEAIARDLRQGIPPAVAEQALNENATILATDRDPLDVLLRRVGALAEFLTQNDSETDRSEWLRTLADLDNKARDLPLSNVTGRRALFAEGIALQRRLAFSNPVLDDFTDILFAKHDEVPLAEMKGNHMIDQFFGFQARPGGGIFVLKDAFSDSPTAVDSLEDCAVMNGRHQGQPFDQRWSFLSPELAYDADEILFAATDASLPRATFTWTKENGYQLFRAKFDPATGKTSDLTQITDDPYNSFDPCYLPNGRIAFISLRRGGYGRCHPRPAPTYTLNSVNADGSDPVVLSWHETNEWAPSVDRSGMILYTRWDYVDRGANNAHHPWITTPDGRDARALVGNYHEIMVGVPIMELDVRQVPESGKLTATAAAHHGQSYGSLILIDPTVPDDNLMSTTRRITPEQPFPEAERGPEFPCPMQYASCYPLSEQFFLCVYDPFALQGNSGCLNRVNHYGIYLLDAFGNRVLLYRDPSISCREPIPVRIREREPVIPHKTLVGRPKSRSEMSGAVAIPPAPETFDPANPLGRKAVDGTSDGARETDGASVTGEGNVAGEVSTPSADLPKTAEIGLVNVYDSTEPFPADVKIKRLRVVALIPKTTPIGHDPAIGAGMQKNARRVLGTVPVEEDGSAFFKVPVNTPIYFQALDENGVAVQSMRTDAYVHPGEVLLCQGCHENRLTATVPRENAPTAMKRTPSEMTPDPDGSDPINFVRLIQPILDAKCADCHARSNDERAIDLTDNPKDAHFSNAFNNLKKFCFFYDDYLWDEPRTSPMNFGSFRSPLYKLLTSDHYGVKLTPEELYRFTLWMDNNVDFYGAYHDIPQQRHGEVVRPELE